MPKRKGRGDDDDDDGDALMDGGSQSQEGAASGLAAPSSAKRKPRAAAAAGASKRAGAAAAEIDDDDVADDEDEDEEVPRMDPGSDASDADDYDGPSSAAAGAKRGRSKAAGKAAAGRGSKGGGPRLAAVRSPSASPGLPAPAPARGRDDDSTADEGDAGTYDEEALPRMDAGEDEASDLEDKGPTAAEKYLVRIERTHWLITMVLSSARVLAARHHSVHLDDQSALPQQPDG
jgi:hypothetical protein